MPTKYGFPSRPKRGSDRRFRADVDRAIVGNERCALPWWFHELTCLVAVPAAHDVGLVFHDNECLTTADWYFIREQFWAKREGLA